MPIQPEAYRAKDGTVTFRVRIELPRDPITGERRRPWITQATEAGCKAEALRLLEAARRGTRTTQHRLTVAQFFDRWLEDEKKHVRPGTYRNDASAVRASILPYLGSAKLKELTSLDIVGWLSWLADERGLAAGTIRRVRALFVRALNAAKEWKLVEENVVATVKPPRGKERAPVVLTQAEVAAFLVAAQTDSYEPFWTLAVATGARIGELLGLQWPDLELDRGSGGVVTISKQLTEQHKGQPRELAAPKSAAGSRQVAIQPWAAERLRTFRAIDNARHLAQPGWNPHRFVVVNGLGKVPWDETIRLRMADLAARAGIRPCRPHDLRHTHTAQLVAAGVPDKVIQERLGHADGRMSDHYKHVYPGLHEEAIAHLPTYLGLTPQNFRPNDGLMGANGNDRNGADSA